ncbi:MAG: DUF1080 domain-containing protein [Planctomycetaceae bacterium]|nr:DUF1080 domain-containing protein [Planctomycetaceae bacterium]
MGTISSLARAPGTACWKGSAPPPSHAAANATSQHEGPPMVATRYPTGADLAQGRPLAPCSPRPILPAPAQPALDTMWTSLALAAALSAAPPTDLARFEFRRPVFGVEARLVLYAADEERAEAASLAAFRAAEELDWALSDWRDDGALGALAQVAGADAVEVPAVLALCFTTARAVAEASGGAFDPTAAPLTRLWRAARAEGRLPDHGDIAAAREKVDWRALELTAAGSSSTGWTARLARPGMSLDLGGIAKGFAAERLLAELTRAGVGSALVELGGDLALSEAPPGRPGWSVRVGTRDLVLSRCHVATSGDAEQHFDAAGRRWSHVLDPRTGLALVHGRTTTVIAGRGALADALASAASVLTVPEAEALVARYPDARLVMQHADSRALANGVDLSGWTAVGGRYDGDARWSVEDGAIVGRAGPNGEGGLLYTEQLFSAFELEFETKIDWPFDSGLFFHMLPPDSGLKGMQVTLDHRPGGEIAALYADGFLVHNEGAGELFARNQWNHVRVRSTGFDPRVEVWIEDQKVLDFQLPEGEAGYARHGRIGLQVHDVPSEDGGSDRAVRVRNVSVRELPVFGEAQLGGPATIDAAPSAVGLAPAALEAGWRDLLASGLAGFQTVGDAEGYRIEGGVLRVPADGSGHIGTADDFRDFELSFDFQLATAANSGLFVRAKRGDENPAYSGAEIQLIDDRGWEPATGHALLPTQTTGSLYGALPAPPWKRLRPAGEWNRMEVLARGARLAVALNGLVLWDVDTHTLAAEPPFASRAPSGFLGFQRYGAPAVTDGVAVSIANFVLRAR